MYLDDTVKDVYNKGRNSARIMLKCDTGIFTIQISAFLQNSLWLKNDYIVKADALLGVKVMRWLSLTVAYSFNRFNRRQGKHSIYL